jgi:hypothetical protein
VTADSTRSLAVQLELRLGDDVAFDLDDRLDRRAGFLERREPRDPRPPARRPSRRARRQGRAPSRRTE